LSGDVTDRSAYAAPATLTASHKLDAFQSGEPALDDWLRERALENLRLKASHTYVTCLAGSMVVVGFHALCMGQMIAQELPGSMRRNMPRTIPAVLLGRLAVHQDHQGHGLGAALLHDAVQRALRASKEVSARLLIVYAISPAAAAFYARHGFTLLPLETPILALDLSKLGG
jgi:GNAT superfamily N-acetyltransferase